MARGVADLFLPGPADVPSPGRTVTVLPAGVRIRPERGADPAEIAAIGQLHGAAFGDPQVALLVIALRASAGYLAELALVAERTDKPEAPIVGHIMVTRGELISEAGPSVPILILSPLGVLPGDQNRGIGAALTRAALDLGDARFEPLVIVQGHPDYYPRFGFVRGRSIGVLPPEHLGAIDHAWMVRRRPDAPPDIRGRVIYPKQFLDLDT